MAASKKKRTPTRRITSLDEIPDTHKIVCWLYSKGRTRIMCAPRNPRSKAIFPCVFTLVNYGTTLGGEPITEALIADRVAKAEAGFV